MVYPANAFDYRLRGDSVPLGSSPTKSQKEHLTMEVRWESDSDSAFWKAYCMWDKWLPSFAVVITVFANDKNFIGSPPLLTEAYTSSKRRPTPLQNTGPSTGLLSTQSKRSRERTIPTNFHVVTGMRRPTWRMTVVCTWSLRFRCLGN